MKNINTSCKYKFCVILGGGGHAAVLIESLLECGLDIVHAVLDENPSLWGKEILGVPILGGDALLPALVEQGADCFVVGLGMVGNSQSCRQLYDYGVSLGLEPLTVIHPTAHLSPSARLGKGCHLLPQSVVHTRSILGNNVLINSGAIVEHDCVLGNHVHVATGAMIAGGVEIGWGTLVGIGATVRQGVRIGKEAIIGAGAAVVRDVPDKVVAMGVPAKVRNQVYILALAATNFATMLMGTDLL
jgi:sugar O-acyltransferase (sialic acid O-acetyltransferase NeuD family)